jgi:putative ABC transport system permease protein
MRTFWTDVRYGARRMVSRPGFLVVSVVTLALGIGATTAIYSVIDALVLRPLPYPRPLFQIHAVQSGGFLVPFLAFKPFDEWRRQNDIFERVEAYSPGSHVLTGGGEPKLVITAAVTGGLMEIIGATAQLGRTLQPADSEGGGNLVAVIADRLWRDQFGEDPGVIGRTIQLDDKSYEIVGVMKPAFRFPYGNRQVWIPLTTTPPRPGTRSPRYETIVVLKPGLSLEQAQDRMDGVVAGLVKERPNPGGWEARLRPFQERRLNKPVERALYVLFAAVGVVLLIACANLANLLLVQGAGREREVAVRAALGAGRGRLIRQLMSETVVLAMAGGVAGVCLALWGVDLLARLAPRDMTFLSVNEIAVDARVLLFAFGLTLLTALLFGTLPALRGSRLALDDAIKAGPRGSTGSVRHQRLRNAFVVAQLALSLMLLVAGGLLARTFIGLTHVDPGFEPKGLVAVDLSLPRWKYPKPDSQWAFYRTAVERLRAIPGVEAVTLAGGMPPDGGSISFGMKFEIDGRGIVLDEPDMVMPYTEVDVDYFDVMRIPVLAGRGFTADDAVGRPPVILINESMARRFFGEPQRAIGQRLRTGGDPEAFNTIVGVAGDVFQFDHSKPRGAFAMYYPLRQQPSLGGQQTLIVRTAAGMPLPGDAIRQQIWSIDPAQAIYDMASAEDMYYEFFATPRFYALLMTVFAAIGACIAAVGLYGVLAYAVAQRTREFGIRFALGARREDILRLALGQGARVTAAGLVLGAAGSLVVTRGMDSMLVGLRPTDPVTYLSTIPALVIAASLASWLPSRRAAAVEPAVALRQE